jgi:hypothetical protein
MLRKKSGIKSARYPEDQSWPNPSFALRISRNSEVVDI